MSALATLSARERQVYDGIVSGKAPAQIAKDLCLSAKTVSTYREHVLRKLGCRGTADLVRLQCTQTERLLRARLEMIRDGARTGASLAWIRAVAEEGLRGEPLLEPFATESAA